MIPILPLLHNQLVGGGLVLMFTGSAIALLRNLPVKIYDKFRSQFMVSVSVLESDPLFEWITLWLAEHPYSRRTRRIQAKTKDDNSRNKEERSHASLPEILYSPSKGEHFFFHQRRFIWLSRGKESEGKTQDGGGSGNEMLRRMTPDQYTFRTIGRSQRAVRSLINDVLVKTMREREERTAVYTSCSNWWDKLFSYTARPLESVFLDGNKKEELLEDMRNFLKERDWYVKRGVPYGRKYMFYGPPGNGKTSIIGALAGELGLNLYVLNLSDSSIGDSSLATLARNVRPNSLLLLEDVDAAVPSRTNIEKEVSAGQPSLANNTETEAATEKERKGITLSGLLNILDGVLTPDGIMVVMTTNRFNILDPALVRPGRVDLKMEFSFATRTQMLQSFHWFYPDRSEQAAQEFADQFTGSVSMATVQQKLMGMKDSPAAFSQTA